MAGVIVNICPNFPYDCNINFWNLWGDFDFYRTIKATSTSTITSAKIEYEIERIPSPVNNITAEVSIKVNDSEVKWAYFEGSTSGTIDVGAQIKPPLGYTGEVVNKITFSFKNTSYPIFGTTYRIKKAYLILEYSGEAPTYPTAPESTSEETKGTTGTESLDQMLGYMMQFMLMFMMMSMMMSMMEGFRGKA
jgi:ABC-type Na+ efflux pump permease subunit